MRLGSGIKLTIMMDAYLQPKLHASLSWCILLTPPEPLQPSFIHSQRIAAQSVTDGLWLAQDTRLDLSRFPEIIIYWVELQWRFITTGGFSSISLVKRLILCWIRNSHKWFSLLWINQLNQSNESNCITYNIHIRPIFEGDIITLHFQDSL